MIDRIKMTVFKKRIMKYKNKKIKLLVVGTLILLVSYLLFLFASRENNKDLQEAFWVKFRWGIELPAMEYDYKYSEYGVYYAVYKCNKKEADKIVTILFEQPISNEWKDNINGQLTNYNINSLYYPEYHTIDYAIRKNERQSCIYLLYSSSASYLYLYETLE